MLCFVLTGRIGRIRCGADELQLALASTRLHGQSPTTTWVACAARDQVLRSRMTRRLSAGSIVRIEGEIEPRRREIKGVAFYDVVFVAKSFEVLATEPLPSC